jgi:elongation factor G
MNRKAASGWRNIAIVGPYLSGKTTLLESILSITGKLSRKGNVTDGNTVSDHAPEARDRHMSVEVSAASTEYGGVQFTYLDCPGSIEFAQETYNALIGVGTAIVVCEPDVSRVLTLAPLFKFLDDWEIPHLVFINKMDRAASHFTDVLAAINTVSSRPLLPQQYPIRNDRDLVGFIDLIDEHAYSYAENAPATEIALPESLRDEEQAARRDMLEGLADFDDQLLETLLDDGVPTSSEILADLKQDLGADLVVPVFFGIADRDWGVRPLLDALVREAPEPSVTAERRGFVFQDTDQPVAQVLKTYYTALGGKQSLVRVWHGTLTEGMILNGMRSGGMHRLFGSQQISVQEAHTGEIVAISRLETAVTGDTLSPDLDREPLPRADRLVPVYALAIVPENRNDEVKISAALAKLIDEDPALHWEQHGDTHEVILWGQGEIHLKVSLARLDRKYNLPMTTRVPRVAYKETIRKAIEHVNGRYKHQSGGHGQFGDVYLDVTPLERGAGFNFSEAIIGGVVPKQYISGVEMGVREYLKHGPLGFPVVDVAVKLTDGSYHSVDSSEQAFKQAARVAMQDALQRAEPTLLEPIALVEIGTPNEFTSKILQAISGRRGQILGYEARDGWANWDTVSAHIPQAEMQDLIIELRSLTLGVGTYSWQADHLQPVPEKLADRVLAQGTPA